MHTLRYTQVGDIPRYAHPEVHPGGYIHCYAHPEVHPGGYVHHCYTLRYTQVGMYTSDTLRYTMVGIPSDTLR